MDDATELTLPAETKVNRLSWTRHFTVFRVVTAIGLIAAIALALLVPVHMTDPDDWAYYYAAQNFAQGQLTVSGAVHTQQVSEAQSLGGQLIQYYNINGDTWAFEKAPGYVLYLVPFVLLHIPRWGNVLLAIGMTAVTFIFLKRLRDEKTAMIGSLLMLLTPVSLIMLNRAYMDTYASLAFLVMGGGLYLYYYLERKKIGARAKWWLLCSSFFFIAWAVVTRYTNLPVAMLFALHFAVTSLVGLRRGCGLKMKAEILPVLIGIGVPLAVLLVYNYLVFGSPLDYGYQYTRFPIKFAFQYLGQVSQDGQSMPLQIIWNNLRSAPRALLLGFPLLAIGIPAALIVLYNKLKRPRAADAVPGRWSSLRRELPWDILLILIGWFVSVFVLYLTYEWTAEFQGNGSFITFSRFYLPGLFPVAVICALMLVRLPARVYIPLTALVLGFSATVYAQFAWNLNILPAWFGSGTPGGFPTGGQPNLPGGGIPGGAGSGGHTPGGGFPGGGPPTGSPPLAPTGTPPNPVGPG